MHSPGCRRWRLTVVKVGLPAHAIQSVAKIEDSLLEPSKSSHGLIKPIRKLPAEVLLPAEVRLQLRFYSQ